MHYQNDYQTPVRQPISGMKHFWLSFLAVVTGLPVAGLIMSAGFFILMVILALIIALAGGSGGSSTKSLLSTRVLYGNESARDTIASVPISGVILSGSAADPLQSLFGASYADGELIKSQLMALAQDLSVKGVVLEIDSPGGMITASKAIADGVSYYRNTTKKPIVAHINGTGASGAYWSAASTDAIYAEQGSEVGSIGVILGPIVSYKGIVSDGNVSTNEPIQYRYITSGISKDLGSPYRDMTPEEVAFLQSEVDLEYERFVAFVSERRSIPADTIKTDVKALAYGTTTALSKKLMDKELSREQTYEELASRAHTNSYNVRQVQSDNSFFGSLFGAQGLLKGKLTAAERSQGRTRFCSTNLIGKPLALSGDTGSVCK
jgi:protease IV